MTDYQDDTCVSFPYLTTACFSLIGMNLVVFPIECVWKKVFPDFCSLSRHIRRHDINLLMRVLVGPVILVPILYVVVKTLQDINWWVENRLFVCNLLLVFLLLDIFDLSQKRRFEWHPYVHHIAQTAYAMYYIEWGPVDTYNRGFPCMGLVVFSLSHKPMLGLFPVRRVSPNQELITKYAKIAFADVIFAIVAGLGVMLAMIIKHRDHLPLSAMISQPIMFLFFNGIDIPFYTFIYRCAYPNSSKQKEETDRATSDNDADNKENIDESEKDAGDEEDGVCDGEPGARASTLGRATLMLGRARQSLVADLGTVINKDPRNSLFDIPYFDDYEDDDRPGVARINRRTM